MFAILTDTQLLAGQQKLHVLLSDEKICDIVTYWGTWATTWAGKNIRKLYGMLEQCMVRILEHVCENIGTLYGMLEHCMGC